MIFKISLPYIRSSLFYSVLTAPFHLEKYTYGFSQLVLLLTQRDFMLGRPDLECCEGCNTLQVFSFQTGI